MQQQGYSAQQTSEAINQADIKNVAGPSGNYSNYNQSYPSPMGSEGMQPSAMGATPAPITAPAPESPTAETYYPPEQGGYATQPYGGGYGYDRGMEDAMEEIAESVVDERWQKMQDEMGDLPSWKVKVSDDLSSLKEDMMRVESRFDNLEKAIISKTAEYTEGLEDVSADVKALEKVLRNIIEPLTNNIRELSKIVEELKKRKK